MSDSHPQRDADDSDAEDDHDVDMLWLDSIYPPTTADPPPPGAARGPCPTTSGDPDTDEKEYPGSYVIYSNIKCVAHVRIGHDVQNSQVYVCLNQNGTVRLYI